MYQKFLILLTFGLVLSLSASTEALNTARDAVKEWAITERAISREAAEWVEREQLLTDLIDVETQRIERLETELAASEAGINAADEEREELLMREDAAIEKAARIESFLLKAETQLRELRASLPEPLLDDLAPAYQRLPVEGEGVELNIGERMRTVINLMGRIRQFDGAMTLTESIRQLPGAGEEASVRTLYVGLGQAYYLAPDDAGYGLPGESGWSWYSEPKLEDDIRVAIQILDGKMSEPRFVDLSVHSVAEREVSQ